MQRVIGGLRQQTLGACRCPQCFVPFSGRVTRRAGTVASRSLGTTFLTSTTVLCSSIFTAAAIVDADAKTRRRQQWDEAIYDLEQEVVATTARSDALASGTLHVATLADSNKRWLDIATEYEPLPVHTGVKLLKRRLPPNSIYRGDEVSEEPKWTPQQTAIINIATEMLRIEFLILIKERKGLYGDILNILDNAASLTGTQSSDGDNSVLTTTTHKLSHQLHRHLSIPIEAHSRHLARLKLDLRSIATAGPHLQHLPRRRRLRLGAAFSSCEATWSRIARLNDRLRHIFLTADARPASRYLSLYLVCDLLENSKTVPHLSTYNVLLAGLSELQIPSTVDKTIVAHHRTQLPVNESTSALVLQHFARHDNREMFDKWLALNHGEAGLSLITGKSKQESLDDVPEVLKPVPTPMVMSAILAGKIHFDGLPNTLELCHEMSRYGWGLSYDSLSPLLQECAKDKDLATGEAIWRIIRELRQQGKTLNRTRYHHLDRIPRHLYSTMSDLYHAVGAKHQYDLINFERRAVWTDSEMQSFGIESSMAESVPVAINSADKAALLARVLLGREPDPNSQTTLSEDAEIEEQHSMRLETYSPTAWVEESESWAALQQQASSHNHDSTSDLDEPAVQEQLLSYPNTARGFDGDQVVQSEEEHLTSDPLSTGAYGADSHAPLTYETVTMYSSQALAAIEEADARDNLTGDLAMSSSLSSFPALHQQSTGQIPGRRHQIKALVKAPGLLNERRHTLEHRDQMGGLNVA